jgi:hypothetical protein
MLSLAVDNNVLAPLMECLTKSINIKTFRKMLAIYQLLQTSHKMILCSGLLDT